MHARIEFEPAWLLSRKPYRETSELLEALTLSHGRIGLVARGSRGPKAKLRGMLALFRPLLLSWVESGDLGTMTAVESAGPDVLLTGERIFHGWYVNELLLRLLQRHDPHEAVYRDYALTLAHLAGADMEAERALRIFEKRLLEQLGYGLPLDIDFDAARRYRFRANEGFAEAERDDRLTYDGADLIALRDEALASRAALDSARRLLRSALQPYVPRESLKTPQLLREMRELRRGGS